jgi:hypothetical protein
MIKKIFWVLLLANACLLAYLKWGGSLMQDGGALQPALNPEKIKLLGFAPSPVSSTAIAASAPVAASAVPAQPVGETTPAASSPHASADCLEWGEFSGTDLARASEDLASMELGSALSRREVEHSIGYWVYIPPLKNRAEVNAKVARLKRQGVKDFFVVQEKGKWLNAISLNIFKTKEMAQKFRDRLRAKGVRDAVIGERQTRLKFTVFTLRNPDAATLAKLVAWQQGFTGIEMKSVGCK